MKKVSFILALVFCLDTFAQQTINGITLPAKMKGSTGELTLNGGGVRKKSFFKVYVLGLYLEQKSKDAAAILKSNEEYIVQLKITSSVVNSGNMSEAIQEGFEKSLKGNVAPLKSKIDAFNGKLITTIEGEDFKKALLGIWLGSDPVDAALKTGLLGN